MVLIPTAQGPVNVPDNQIGRIMPAVPPHLPFTEILLTFGAVIDTVTPAAQIAPQVHAPLALLTGPDGHTKFWLSPSIVAFPLPPPPAPAPIPGQPPVHIGCVLKLKLGVMMQAVAEDAATATQILVASGWQPPNQHALSAQLLKSPADIYAGVGLPAFNL